MIGPRRFTKVFRFFHGALLYWQKIKIYNDQCFAQLLGAATDLVILSNDNSSNNNKNNINSNNNNNNNNNKNNLAVLKFLVSIQ